MQPMPLTLKRSLATLALLATVAGPEPANAGAEPANPPQAAPADAAKATASAGGAVQAQNEAAMAAFRRRYGLDRTTPTPLVAGAKRQRIETKLDEIILPEIQFDGLPLFDVVRTLSDQATKLDPEKKGVNFLINANNASAPGPTSIDPATGLQVPAPPTEPVDVSSIMVKFSLPLRNVSLKDTLEAVVRVAERPLEYSVEDYGVVLSLKAEATASQVFAARQAQVSDPLFAATFKVDTNTFLAGLENAFGITVPKAEAGQSKARPREIQAALRALLTQLGVSGGDAKTVFYNDLTGIIMVRATAAEQGIIQAAIETLGGTPNSSFGAGGGGFSIQMPGGR